MLKVKDDFAKEINCSHTSLRYFFFCCIKIGLAGVLTVVGSGPTVCLWVLSPRQNLLSLFLIPPSRLFLNLITVERERESPLRKMI